MSAAQAREELEAAIWRNWPVRRADIAKAHAPLVQAILAAADMYAAAVAETGSVDSILGPHRLAEAADEYYRQTVNGTYGGIG